MLMPKPSWLEKIVRPIIVYVALLLAFRFLSKRAAVERGSERADR
jgi:uncharacterized membrane protein YcaP (DUF421 family)